MEEVFSINQFMATNFTKYSNLGWCQIEGNSNFIQQMKKRVGSRLLLSLKPLLGLENTSVHPVFSKKKAKAPRALGATFAF